MANADRFKNLDSKKTNINKAQNQNMDSKKTNDKQTNKPKIMNKTKQNLDSKISLEKPHFVAIIMGSKSDYDVVKECILVLKKFEIKHEIYVSSAHRSPQRTIEIIKDCEARGAAVFIGAAGMAAHLAGAIAAHTLKPVIALPLPGGMMDGLDALLSSVQMPKGVPVATMSMGRAGAINAGYFAAQILALEPQNSGVLKALKEDRKAQEARLIEDTKEINKL